MNFLKPPSSKVLGFDTRTQTWHILLGRSCRTKDIAEERSGGGGVCFTEFGCESGEGMHKCEIGQEELLRGSTIGDSQGLRNGVLSDAGRQKRVWSGTAGRGRLVRMKAGLDTQSRDFERSEAFRENSCLRVCVCVCVCARVCVHLPDPSTKGLAFPTGQSQGVSFC